jgi:hypothetical protein
MENSCLVAIIMESPFLMFPDFSTWVQNPLESVVLVVLLGSCRACSLILVTSDLHYVEKTRG